MAMTPPNSAKRDPSTYKNVPKNQAFRQHSIAAAMLLVIVCISIGAVPRTAAAQLPNSKPQVRRTFPLSKFYDTPSPLPAGKPGELIRKEEFDEYDLSASVSAIRVLYHSRSATGEDVAASGVVLYPEGNPAPGGWPVIAWAHDLNAVARRCAPSLSRNLQHGPFLSMYLALGYAVVATDYTGLGTSFRNAYADMQPNAADIINSITAAQAAVPHLAPHWIAIGTGEGSSAVIKVGELETENKDRNYLGGIVVSGITDLQDRYQRPSAAGVLFLTYGAKTIFPEFAPRDILTEKGLELLSGIDDACGDFEANKRSVAEITKPDWTSNRFMQQYFNRNRPGESLSSAPMLAIDSETDPGGATAKVIARMCKQGAKVQFEKYDVPDSGSLIGDSVRAQISWIQSRFAGTAAPDNCAGAH